MLQTRQQQLKNSQPRKEWFTRTADTFPTRQRKFPAFPLQLASNMCPLPQGLQQNTVFNTSFFCAPGGQLRDCPGDDGPGRHGTPTPAPVPLGKPGGAPVHQALQLHARAAAGGPEAAADGVAELHPRGAEGYLRPGCVHLVTQAVVTANQAHQVLLFEFRVSLDTMTFWVESGLANAQTWPEL